MLSSFVLAGFEFARVGAPSWQNLSFARMDTRELARLRAQASASATRPVESSPVGSHWWTGVFSWFSSRPSDKLPPCRVRADWQPIYPPGRVPRGSSSKPQPSRWLPAGSSDRVAFHGLGRVVVPEVALACTPNSARGSMGTSVVVVPGGAYKFVGMPGQPEVDSVLQWLCCTVGVTAFLLKYRVPTVGPPASPE